MRDFGRFRGIMSAAMLLACLGPDETPRPRTEPAPPPPPPPDPVVPEMIETHATGHQGEPCET